MTDLGLREHLDEINEVYDGKVFEWELTPPIESTKSDLIYFINIHLPNGFSAFINEYSIREDKIVYVKFETVELSPKKSLMEYLHELNEVYDGEEFEWEFLTPIECTEHTFICLINAHLPCGFVFDESGDSYDFWAEDYITNISYAFFRVIKRQYLD